MLTVPGAVSVAPPRTWVLTSKKLGDNAQVLSIANALGWPYEIKRLEFRGLNHFHFRFFGPSPRKVQIEQSSPLRPPWPDLVLTIGRRATPVALWIRRQSRGRTKLVQVGQARVGLDRFDLIIGNPQYHLPQSSNLLHLTLPLFAMDTAVVAAAAATWRSRFAHLPRPWIALFVGGSTAPFTLDVQAAQDLIQITKQIREHEGGSILVTTSRRTASEVATALEAAMPEQGFFHRWSPDDPNNPYRGILGLADRFIVDPDVFAVGDIYELLSLDMQGKAVRCVARPGHNDRPDYLASSVMLLDCAQLMDWRCEEQFNEMFTFRRDYLAWIYLGLESRERIGLLEPVWNHFDTLTSDTKLLHNTKRQTQPWKTGLPRDYIVREKTGWKAQVKGITQHMKGWLLGKPARRGSYTRHPDPQQEALFFELLRKCVEYGVVTEELLREEMRKNHLRHDTLEILHRLPARAAA